MQKNAQIKHILNYIQQFTKDNDPNNIVAGDMNMWLEMNGSEPNMCYKGPHHSKIDDNIWTNFELYYQTHITPNFDNNVRTK